MYQNNILHDKNKQQIKILKYYHMCVLEIIWETIKWNRTNENKYIIKGMIRWRITYKSKKTFKYQHSQRLRNNKNYFSETK